MIDNQREVAPSAWVGVHLQAPFDPADDDVELPMIDPVHEDHTGVRTLRRGPLTKDRREVADVVSHEDPLLSRRGAQHLIVVQSLEDRLLIERTDVMALGLEPPAHPRPGHLPVEQQPDRRNQLPEL